MQNQNHKRNCLLYYFSYTYTLTILFFPLLQKSLKHFSFPFYLIMKDNVSLNSNSLHCVEAGVNRFVFCTSTPASSARWYCPNHRVSAHSAVVRAPRSDSVRPRSISGSISSRSSSSNSQVSFLRHSRHRRQQSLLLHSDIQQLRVWPQEEVTIRTKSDICSWR